MGQYTSYYLYQKFEKRDGQDFIPVYPNTYSVDADGTMPKVVKEQNDVNCGYVPPSDPIYQWVQLTPSSDPDSYWCDNCPAEPIYQWTVMMPTSDPDTYWCDECPAIYRWVDSGTTCVDYDLYQRAIKQVSYDSGTTWENAVPTQYSATTLIEADSPSCGYVPPKLIATYRDSTTYRVGCDSSTTLSQSEVRGHSTSYSAMTSAEIGDCVTSIGASAFTKCYYLANVDIPSGVTSIGEHAFRSCGSLTSVTIPTSVTSIGDSAFDNCGGLNSINIPDSVTSIGEGAFFHCSGATSCTIGSGVTTIGNDAFYRCSHITGVTINAATPPAVGNFAFYNTNNCPIYVPCRSVDVYKSTSGWTTYADRIQGIAPCSPIYRWTDSGTTCVGYDKYQNSIKQVSYDSGTTWENAVPTQYSATTLIEINSHDCSYLAAKLVANYSDSTTYTVECNSSTTLSESAVKSHSTSYTAMTNASIGDCVTEIGHSAFDSCSNLTRVTISNSVATIGIEAFQYCDSLSSCTIGSGVTRIRESAFYRCTSLKRINSDTDGVFNIPSGVTSIDNNAFNYCSGMTSVTMPHWISTIGVQAFANCSGLTSVTIPDNISTISGYAFYNCTNLTGITINITTPPTLGSGAFDNTNNCPIYVPCNYVWAYKAASGWSTYADRILGILPCASYRWVDSGTTCVDYDKYQQVIKQVSYDGGITWENVVPAQYSATTLIEADSPDCGYPPPTGQVKFKATYNNSTSYSAECDSSTTLTTENTRPSGYQHSAMTSAEIGNCIRNISGSAFYNCISLTSCTIGSGVTTIGQNAFGSCSSLTSIGPTGSGASIEIPNSVTSIIGSAFFDCSGLTSVNIPDSVTSIGTYVFRKCSGMTTCTIGSGVTTIDMYAFYECTNLTGITIYATTPPTLGSSAFNNTNNCPIYVPSGSVTAYQSAWSSYASRIQAIPT